MNLYLVSRMDYVDFEEFDAEVVAAESKAAAFIVPPVDCRGRPCNAR